MAKEKFSKRSVVLVHGISSDGAWQDHIAPVLEPFFRVVKVRYPHFRRLGALCVVAEPWVLALAALAIAAYLVLDKFWLLYLAVVLIVISALPIVVEIRRRAAMSAYLAQAGDVFAGNPHLIAHSLGSYLSMRLMREHEDAKFDRVVLIGCVLPESLDWTKLRGHSSFSEVLNDWTSRDLVPLIARYAGIIHDGLGGAGRYGFSSTGGDVHNITDLAADCPSCVVGQTAIVHNVDSSPFGHSDKLLVRSHAARYWLPFLFDILISEYERLRLTCLRYADADEKLDIAAIVEIEAVLQTTRWRWLHDRALADVFKEQLQRAGLEFDSPTISYAVRSFAIFMASALRESCQDSRALHNLDPRQAVRSALVSVQQATLP